MATVAGLAFAFPAAVQAQAVTAADEPQGGLEEIIVTARKRDENVQNIPVAVTAITSEQLVNRNIRSIEQVAVSTPQLIVARGSAGSGANLSIRGIGSNFTSAGIEQSVSVNVDGVYYGQGRILNEAMFDMGSVEILKGPQALFFGKNATAGALSFTTAGPTKDFEAIARGGYEFRTEEKYLEGILSGPITETLGFRIAGRYSKASEGWMKNQGTAGTYTVNDAANGGALTTYDVPAPEDAGPRDRNVALRGTLRYEPDSRLTITAKGSYSNRHASTASYITELFNCPVNNTSQVSPGQECRGNWKTHWTDLPAEVAAGNPLHGKYNGRGYDNYRSYTATGTVSYDADDFTINWVNGYQNFKNVYTNKSDVTGNYNRGTYVGTDTRYRAFSSELRAQTDLKIPVNFMAGGYYQSSKLFFQQDVIFPGTAAAGHRIDSSIADPSLRAINLRKIGHTDGETLAVFGQFLWDIVPKLQFTAGARYTHETKDSDFTQPYISANLRTVYRMFDPAVPLSFIREKQTFKDFSPELTLTYKPTSRLTVYGAYKTGYKSGGFSVSALNTTTTDPSSFSFDPETVEGFEAGIRSQLFDNQLRLNLTAFTYKYQDLQVDFFNSQITSYVTFNAGSARTKGVELDAEFAPRALPGLVLRGSIGYNEARYVSFPGAPCYAGQTPAEGCMPVSAEFNYVHQDLKGVRTALAPKWVGSASVDYETDISSSLKAGLNATMRYSTAYLLSPFGNRVDRQGEFATLDASVRIGAENDRWQLALIGKNLTNRYVLNAAVDTPSTGSGTGTPAGIRADQYGLPSPPRMMTLQLTIRY
jgi:outer membrane receptor protein involved in Fe transport